MLNCTELGKLMIVFTVEIALRLFRRIFESHVERDGAGRSSVCNADPAGSMPRLGIENLVDTRIPRVALPTDAHPATTSTAQGQRVRVCRGETLETVHRVSRMFLRAMAASTCLRMDGIVWFRAIWVNCAALLLSKNDCVPATAEK